MSKLSSLHEEAKKYYIGGASAGQRYHGVLGQPLYLERASGCRLYDVDGNEYIDYHIGAGAALFGHNHPRLRKALEKAMDKGFFMNYDTEYHTELAKRIQKIFPSAEKIRLCNTGSEATQSAIRLARSATGKELIIRFDGHFHGMQETVWYNHNTVAQADQYGEVQTVPDCPGFPGNAKDTVKNVLFNDIGALEHAVKKYKDHLAAIIIEPISFNCGCLIPKKDYLKQVRALCDKEGVILIFDEVITGLRMRPGSAQLHFGVIPDMTTIAKAIGGGFPIAAIAGKESIMKHLNPQGKTSMSGTYTGALIPVLAAVECLNMVLEPGFYDHIETIGNTLYQGINDLFKKHGIQGHARGVGARFGIYFGVEDPEDDYNFRKVAEQIDKATLKKFIHECLPAGLFFHDTAGPVSPAHYGVTSQHTLEDINITLDKMDGIFAKIK
jgi:glutamate-1-semialdehyde 2,1-aminomutase